METINLVLTLMREFCLLKSLMSSTLKHGCVVISLIFLDKKNSYSMTQNWMYVWFESDIRADCMHLDILNL